MRNKMGLGLIGKYKTIASLQCFIWICAALILLPLKAEEAIISDENLNCESHIKKFSFESMYASAGRIRKLIDQMKTYQFGDDQENTVGAVGQIQSKANKLSIERLKRKSIEKEILMLIDLIDELFMETAKSNEGMISKLEQEISEIQNKKEKSEEIRFDSADSFRYFTLDNKATLRQISALPEVFGDEEYWVALYNANRNTIGDPSSILAPGTKLIVPKLKLIRDFNF